MYPLSGKPACKPSTGTGTGMLGRPRSERTRCRFAFWRVAFSNRDRQRQRRRRCRNGVPVFSGKHLEDHLCDLVESQHQPWLGGTPLVDEAPNALVALVEHSPHLLRQIHHTPSLPPSSFPFRPFPPPGLLSAAGAARAPGDSEQSPQFQGNILNLTHFSPSRS